MVGWEWNVDLRRVVGMRWIEDEIRVLVFVVVLRMVRRKWIELGWR